MGKEYNTDLKEEIIKFIEKAVPPQNCRLAVREDGPDAWGDCFSIPDGSLVRWDSGSWQYVEKGGTQWVTSVGTEVDVVCFQIGARLVWNHYYSESM